MSDDDLQLRLSVAWRDADPKFHESDADAWREIAPRAAEYVDENLQPLPGASEMLANKAPKLFLALTSKNTDDATLIMRSIALENVMMRAQVREADAAVASADALESCQAEIDKLRPLSETASVEEKVKRSIKIESLLRKHGVR